MSEKSEMSQDDKIRLGIAAGRAFSPGSPIREKDVFAGRMQQIRQVIDAINQDGRSVLIYGERGAGKTSLANVIDEFYLSIAQARIYAPHIACETEDSFHSIWIRVLKEHDRARPTLGLSETCEGEIDNIINESNGSLSPHCIKSIADIITQTHLMIPIIDEFDRVRDPYAVSQFTDTIKYLSDHTRNTTLILVGVGDTVDDLVNEHASVERALEQVLMPRMTESEASEILRHGSDATGVNYSAEALSLIASIAKGLPHYVQLLGLKSMQAAIDAGLWVVDESHVDHAVKQAVVASERSLLKAHHDATTSPRTDNLFKEVLLACALAKTDDLGYFAAVDVRDPLSRIMGEPYEIARYTQHLAAFASEERGNVLQRIGSSRRYRFRFRNPLFQPFVVLQGMRDGRISREDVRGLFAI